MGNLSNLFISQSFKSLIHLETDNSASSALTELQDGVGTPLGLFVNTDGDFQAVGEISSSLLAGVGNVTLYSASVDFRLDALQSFTSSQIILNSGFSTTASFNTYTSSTDGRLDNIEITTASLVSSVTQLNSYTASVLPVATGSLLVTASVNFTTFTFTKGNGSTFDLYADTGSLTTLSQFNSYTASQAAIIATTGSNTFVGNNTFSGSVKGNVIPITVDGFATASLDCSVGNFFTVTLPSGSINLVATNISGGETITLRVKQPSSGSAIIATGYGIKESVFNPIILTNTVNAEDVITFVSFDTGSLYGVVTQNFT